MIIREVIIEEYITIYNVKEDMNDGEFVINTYNFKSFIRVVKLFSKFSATMRTVIHIVKNILIITVITNYKVIAYVT